MMNQSAKKKSKKKNTAQAATSGGYMQTFEIRKMVRAQNIVEALNLELKTPPYSIVMLEQYQEQETPQVVGFKVE